MYIEKEIIEARILTIFSENSDKTFIVDAFTGKNYTYKEISDLSLKLGNYLKKKGIGSGDKIVFVLHNSVETAIMYFASMFIGAVSVPINPSFHHRDIKFIIDSVCPKLIVSSAVTMSYLKDLFSEERIICIEQFGKNNQGEKHGKSNIFSLDIIKDLTRIKPFEEIDDEDPYLTIIYTSGTTSRPKGVVHRRSDLINNASAFCTELDITDGNRFLCILPMTYLGGYYNLLFLPFVAGSSVVIWENFGPKTPLTFWDIIEKHDVNTLWFVPTIIAIMLKIDRSDKGPKLCKQLIKRALVGTAPLPLTMKHDFEIKYGVKLYENYGLSETLFITTESPRYPFVEKSVGRVIEGVEIVIKDDEGKILPVNNEGEIWLKSPHLMEGYYLSEKDGTDTIEKDEYYSTGDIGYVAPKGEVFITGRKKDLIIKGGVNISSKTVEDVLHEYPNVEEAVVVGVPHEIYGEDIAAVLKIKAGVDFKKEFEKIKEYCKENLSSTQCPTRYLEIEEFPKSLTGKIQKHKVKNMLSAKLGLSTSSVYQIEREKHKSNKFLMITSKVKKDIERPSKGIIEAFKKYPTSLISDCLNRLRVMKDISPVIKGKPFVGPAFTVEEVEGGNLMSHIALEYIQPGDVLVIDSKGVTSRSSWGELQTGCAERKEIAGIVVYGAIRDIDEIENRNIPVYSLGTSPAGPLKGWGGFVNFPVNCAGVAVLPGDIVIGDNDGVVVVPKDFAKEVLGYCKKRLKKEEEWFRELTKGKTTIDIVGLRDSVSQLNIEYS